MALDHYVSQVHLKQFAGPGTQRQPYAIRKSDLKEFSPRTKDVCRIEDGNSNPYLDDTRFLERLLARVEPAYEPCLTRLRLGIVDEEIREVFGGFAAAILICSPTFARLTRPGTQSLLTKFALDLADRGQLPALPDVGDARFDGRSASALLREGLLEIEPDMKMPQAMLATKLQNLVGVLSSCDWDVLDISNEHQLLTSDYPMAKIERSDEVFSRVLPLHPQLGIVMHTPKVGVISYPTRVARFQVTSRSVMSELNRAVVQSAEDLIFYSKQASWIKPFVEKHRSTRLDVSPDFSELVYSNRP